MTASPLPSLPETEVLRPARARRALLGALALLGAVVINGGLLGFLALLNPEPSALPQVARPAAGAVLFEQRARPVLPPPRPATEPEPIDLTPAAAIVARSPEPLTLDMAALPPLSFAPTPLQLDRAVPGLAAASVWVPTERLDPDRLAPAALLAGPERAGTLSTRDGQGEGGEGRDAVSAAEVDQMPRPRGHQATPFYPESMRQRGIEGPVQLELVIGLRGEVESVRAMTGLPEFGQAAERAAQRWRFHPARHQGQPVRVRVAITVHFSLDQL